MGVHVLEQGQFISAYTTVRNCSPLPTTNNCQQSLFGFSHIHDEMLMGLVLCSRSCAVGLVLITTAAVSSCV